MATEIVMPRLGWTMEEGLLVEWLKKDGDPVQAGDILFTVESDKALNEVEALDSGILRIPPESPPPGSTIPVGAFLAYLVQPGEGLQAAAQSDDLPAISPRARRIARELGVDWTALKGSGRSGRILERDVRARRPAQPSAPVPAAPDSGLTAAPQEERIPLSPVRRAIAGRMAASARTTAPVTLITEADATELVRLRRQLKGDAAASARPVPTYTDLLVKVCAAALAEHPMLNARLDGDEIVLSSAAHIGIAVESERGLLVAVIRDAGAKTVRQIAAESAALVESARAGKLKADQSTFTITNLGMYEIDAFTPIINLPECAVLGVGHIRPRQVVIDADAERVAIRHMMFLSLTFDHRLVDGAPAARFVQRVRQLVEQPYLWLVE